MTGTELPPRRLQVEPAGPPGDPSDQTQARLRGGLVVWIELVLLPSEDAGAEPFIARARVEVHEQEAASPEGEGPAPATAFVETTPIAVREPERARCRRLLEQAARDGGSAGGSAAAVALLTRSLDASDEVAMNRIEAKEGPLEPLPRPATVCPGRLTEREVEVLRLIAEGGSNQRIADQLQISQFTVARHISNIFDKTGAANRAEAAVFAARHDLL